MEFPERQDLHESHPVGPDRAWPKPDLPIPSEERLKAPASWVNVCNTGEAQTHIILDRQLHGYEIGPGQTMNLHLLDADIDYFIERRKPRIIQRIVNSRLEQLTVRHPIEIRDEFNKPLKSRDKVLASAPVAPPRAPLSNIVDEDDEEPAVQEPQEPKTPRRARPVSP